MIIHARVIALALRILVLLAALHPLSDRALAQVTQDDDRAIANVDLDAHQECLEELQSEISSAIADAEEGHEAEQVEKEAGPRMEECNEHALRALERATGESARADEATDDAADGSESASGDLSGKDETEEQQGTP